MDFRIERLGKTKERSIDIDKEFNFLVGKDVEGASVLRIKSPHLDITNLRPGVLISIKIIDEQTKINEFEAKVEKIQEEEKAKKISKKKLKEVNQVE